MKYPSFLLSMLSVLLGGCQFHPASPEGRSVTRVHTAPAPVPNAQAIQQERLKRLLADADYALSRDRLLSPVEDNAFDRYQSVLLLDPDNQQARTGLQAIALRYIEMARGSIGRGNYSLAQTQINNARGIDPQSPLLEETTQLLRRQRAANPPPPAYKPGPDERLLDVQELTRKSQAIQARLGELAREARARDDLVIIYARNDAEGRWIYSQMREALEDYLLRGDIRIANQPRIQFVPIQ